MKRNTCVDSGRRHDLNRREFLEVSAGAAALGMVGWPLSVGAQTGDGLLRPPICMDLVSTLRALRKPRPGEPLSGLLGH